METNPHLVWTMLAGCAVGVLLRARGWRKALAVVPFGAAVAHHILDNYTDLHAYGAAETVAEGMDSWLWAAPLIVLVITMSADIVRQRRARQVMPDTLLDAERRGSRAVAALGGYAAWCVPWSTLIVLRFARLRRCLAYAESVASPMELESLRRLVTVVAERIDASDREEAWRDLDVRAIQRAARSPASGVRRWLPVVSWVLAIPPLVLLGIGTFPAAADVAEFLGTGVWPGVITGLGVAGLVMVGGRLMMLLADGAAVRDVPVGEVLAVVRWRICTAVGSATAGILLLCQAVDGAGAGGTVVSNFHLLDALSTFEVYLGFALLLLSLLVLFPPGALVVAGGSGLLAAGVTADAVATAAGLGSVGVVLMAAGGRGGSRSSDDSGDGGGRGGRGGDTPASSKPPAERAKSLGYDRRIAPHKLPFNSHGQPGFFNGKTYITPDIDAHNVSNGWKMFSRRGVRIGTYDGNLNWIKD